MQVRQAGANMPSHGIPGPHKGTLCPQWLSWWLQILAIRLPCMRHMPLCLGGRCYCVICSASKSTPWERCGVDRCPAIHAIPCAPHQHRCVRRGCRSTKLCTPARSYQNVQATHIKTSKRVRRGAPTCIQAPKICEGRRCAICSAKDQHLRAHRNAGMASARSGRGPF